jgi:hypothetical protein
VTWFVVVHNPPIPTRDLGTKIERSFSNSVDRLLQQFAECCIRFTSLFTRYWTARRQGWRTVACCWRRSFIFCLVCRRNCLLLVARGLRILQEFAGIYRAILLKFFRIIAG